SITSSTGTPAGTIDISGIAQLTVAGVAGASGEGMTVTLDFACSLTATTTAITSVSAGPYFVGSPYTVNFTVTASTGVLVPTGAVVVTDGLGSQCTSGPLTSLGTNPASVSGFCQLTPGSAGNASVVAAYGGDSIYGGGQSSPYALTVNTTDSATGLISSLNPSTFGQSVTFTATVTASGPTPTGTIGFYDGATLLSTATLAGGAASYSTSTLSGGTHTIAAQYGGDTHHTGSSTSLTQQVDKATPTVTTWPTASNISYGQTLASSTLSGGVATPAGSFGWTTPSTAPGAGTASQSVTYTPTDTTNYNTATGSASVTVAKADPNVTTWPTASGITYGQTLASSTLSGGAATPAGSFAFTTPSTAPGAGTASQSVTYTPTDTTNYNTATGSASVTVAKADPNVTTWPTATGITY